MAGYRIPITIGWLQSVLGFPMMVRSSEHAREIDVVMMKFDIAQCCCLIARQSIVYGEPMPCVQILFCCHNDRPLH